MYRLEDIEAMCGERGALPEALYEGIVALDEGIAGKILSIGALLAGTFLSGCAGTAAPAVEPVTIDIPAETPVTADSVTKLALEIADGIHDEMGDSSRVTSTKSWQAAKDIYGKLVSDKKQALANSFARTINRKTAEFFNAPPCCDDKTYDNSEQAEQNHEPVFDEETGMTEYN